MLPIDFGRKPGFIIDSDIDPENYRVVHEVEVPHE